MQTRLTIQLVDSLPSEMLAIEALRMLEAESGGMPNDQSLDRVLSQNLPGWTGVHSRKIAEAVAYMKSEAWISPDPTQSSTSGYCFVTTRGKRALESDGTQEMLAERRLSTELHPLIAERVRRQYMLGEYEQAAHISMREVEIQVRKRAGADKSEIGVRLMKDAFGAKGPLRNAEDETGEQEAMMALYWGAIGVFKNPSSHRKVEYDDPVLASEVVLLADLLLRLLDRSGG